jgi:hypothetical protein
VDSPFVLARSARRPGEFGGQRNGLCGLHHAPKDMENAARSG